MTDDPVQTTGKPGPRTEAGKALTAWSESDMRPLDEFGDIGPSVADAILAIEEQAATEARRDLLAALENEDVVTWGDDGHRERFIRLFINDLHATPLPDVLNEQWVESSEWVPVLRERETLRASMEAWYAAVAARDQKAAWRAANEMHVAIARFLAAPLPDDERLRMAAERLITAYHLGHTRATMSDRVADLAQALAPHPSEPTP